MPTTQELALILRFRDEASAAVKATVGGIRGAFQQLATGLGTLEENLRSSGRAFRALGREMLQAGLIISGPFLLALRTASQHDAEARDVLRHLNNEFIQLQVVIAETILPIMRQLADGIRAVKEWFQSLDQSTRETVLRFIFLIGITLSINAVFARLLGNLLLLAANFVGFIKYLVTTELALSSMQIAGITVIGALVALVLMFQQGDTALQKFGRTIDITIDEFKLMAQTILSVLGGALVIISTQWSLWLNLMARVPIVGGMFKGLAKDVTEFRNTMILFTAGEGKDLVTTLETIKVHALAGGGAFEGMAKQIDQAIDAAKRLTAGLAGVGGGKQTTATGLFGFDPTTFKQSIKDFWDSFTDITKRSVELISGGINSLESNFTTLFKGLIDGTVKAKDFFKEFAKSVLEAIASMIAKFFAFIAAVGVIAAILAPFGVGPGSVFKAAFKFIGAFHQGGYVGGLPKYHAGGEVLAALQPGEFVVNKEATSKNRGLLEQINNGTGSKQPGMVIVNNWNINATDAQSFRNQMSQHNDLVEAMFQRAIKRNSGAMRQSVRT